ncbi:hypothetical protein PGT21_027186 [Puccinia graminis f. sp. tritici]|uniref:Chromo domain-containing protein n=1 Tax=Puccinia graminis f. sp. tritici TaxID=56615 RepID=A0A5B0N1X6_PUCGR|nr:hypothetical protein PGT21_027186 [Puccinia graminis f. sp. tritici]
MRNRKSQQQEWAANQILREKGGKYLIEWSGLDPATGRPWEPSWEPKKMANRALVADWRKAKHQKTPESHSDTPLPTPAYTTESSKPVCQGQASQGFLKTMDTWLADLINLHIQHIP